MVASANGTRERRNACDTRCPVRARLGRAHGQRRCPFRRVLELHGQGLHPAQGLFDLVCDVRSRTGLQLVPVDQAPTRMLRALRSGALVVLAADRDATGTGVPATFFGARALVPDGYARLSVLANAPILVVSSNRRTDDTFELRVERLLEPVNTGHRDADAQALVAGLDVPDFWLSELLHSAICCAWVCLLRFLCSVPALLRLFSA